MRTVRTFLPRRHPRRVDEYGVHPKMSRVVVVVLATPPQGIDGSVSAYAVSRFPVMPERVRDWKHDGTGQNTNKKNARLMKKQKNQGTEQLQSKKRGGGGEGDARAPILVLPLTYALLNLFLPRVLLRLTKTSSRLPLRRAPLTLHR